jgi:hypothetical protein
MLNILRVAPVLAKLAGVIAALFMASTVHANGSLSVFYRFAS